jgi:hypothetical protein
MRFSFEWEEDDEKGDEEILKHISVFYLFFIVKQEYLICKKMYMVNF